MYRPPNEELHPLCLLHQYNEANRPKFNPQLFQYSEETLIEDLKKIVLSAQKSLTFTIRVEGFELIDDYETIIHMIRDYNDVANKNFELDNPFRYINLKDTDMKLLVVHYYIAIKDQEKRVQSLIGIPRIVDKYYYRINGSYYSVLWQVVDASTYSNNTSKNKKPAIAFRTCFMAMRIYRYEAKRKYILTDCFTKEVVPCSYFLSCIATKTMPCMKYILGKFGLFDAQAFLGLGYINIYDHDPIELENYGIDIYIFNRHNIWITIPKYIFDATAIAQSFVWTLVQSITKYATRTEFFSTEYWLISLASEFGNTTVEKGLSVLDSLEFMYDLYTLENLALPYRDKKNVYNILAWIMGDFNTLQMKDNLDITIKRVVKPLSSLYAMKISEGIYRISDIGKKATLKTIERAIITNPMYLLNAITNCQLANYRNFVNDLDALVALKFTYKGISGIGEKKNSVPVIMRAIHTSHLGIVDLDASSAGDPGVTGKFVPYAQIYEHGMLSPDYREPNNWRKELTKVMNGYKALTNRREGFIAEEKLFGFVHYTDEEVKELNTSIDIIQNLLKPHIPNLRGDSMDYIMGLPLEDSGSIIYTSVEVAEDEEGFPITIDEENKEELPN